MESLVGLVEDGDVGIEVGDEDLKDTQGQSFSSNIDEKSTGNPSPRLTSYTKRCTTSSNILYTIFIFGDRGHQVIIHPLKRENFLVPASPPVLPARRCPCPSPVRGGLCQQAELREEGESRLFGEEEHRLERSSSHF